MKPLTRNLSKRVRKHWTPSCLKSAEQCPAKYFWTYEDVVLGKPETSPAAERGHEIHAQLENYLLGTSIVLPNEAWAEPMRALKTSGAIAEELWELDREWKRTARQPPWGRLRMDAYWLSTDHITVVDFKTGRVYPEHDDQMQLYAIAAGANFPATHVTAELWYIDRNETHAKTYSREELDDLQPYWEKRAQDLLTRTIFPETPSEEACRWCPFSKKKGGPCRSA